MRLHLIALGANLPGTRAGNLRRVLGAARALPGRLVALSRPWASPAWPPGRGQPGFVNAVALVASPLPPEAMLARLHRIEAAAGRVRGERWAIRPLDLDLLASGRLVRPDPVTLRAWIAMDAADQAGRAPPGLVLPHPRIADRAFVLLPLLEVRPLWRHPLTGRTARAMAAALPLARRAGTRPLAPGAALVKREPRA